MLEIKQLQKAKIVEVRDILNPRSPSNKVWEVEEGTTVFESFKLGISDRFVDFASPVILLLNGKPLLREHWKTTKLKSNDVLTIQSVVGIAWFAVVAVIAIVISVITLGISLYLLFSAKKPKNLDDPESVYNLTGQKNQVKLNQPIERPYGRCRVFPSYAARPYNRYINNKQWQYNLFCIGHGDFQIEDIYLEDTPIANFKEVQYEVYRPYESPTMFPDHVTTSVEVNNVELYAPNDENFSEFVGAFVVSDAGAENYVNKLEVDISFPSGLFVMRTDGGQDATTVCFIVQYQRIDDYGNPIAVSEANQQDLLWNVLVNTRVTLCTNTPQRFTYEKNVPLGRYQIRAMRYSNKVGSGSDACFLEGARGFVPSKTDYGDVTLLAVAAVAGNDINDNSQARVNCFVTPRIPWFDIQTNDWQPPRVTRSIAWAFCDAITSIYGGNLPRDVIDIDSILAAHDYFESRERDQEYNYNGMNYIVDNRLFFDGIFDIKQTLWETLKTICAAGRAFPVIQNGKIGIKLNVPQDTPAMMFTPKDIIKDSLTISVTSPETTDGYSVEFTNPLSWLQDTIIAKKTDQEGIDTEELKLLGVTSDLQAWRTGMYLEQCRRIQTETVTFTTGLESVALNYGDTIYLEHENFYNDNQKWTGFITRYDYANRILVLSDVVPDNCDTIYFRTKDGKPSSPHLFLRRCTGEKIWERERKIELVNNIPDLDNYVMDATEGVQPSYFIAQPNKTEGKMFVVQEVKPNNDGTASVTAKTYSPYLYYYDDKFPEGWVPPETRVWNAEVFGEPKNLQLITHRGRRRNNNHIGRVNTEYFFKYWANWTGSKEAIRYDYLYLAAPSEEDLYKALYGNSDVGLANVPFEYQSYLDSVIDKVLDNWYYFGNPFEAGFWLFGSMFESHAQDYFKVKSTTESSTFDNFDDATIYEDTKGWLAGNTVTDRTFYYAFAVRAVHKSGLTSAWSVLSKQDKIIKSDIPNSTDSVNISMLTCHSTWKAVVLDWQTSVSWQLFQIDIFDVTEGSDVAFLARYDWYNQNTNSSVHRFEYTNIMFINDTKGNEGFRVQKLKFIVCPKDIQDHLGTNTKEVVFTLEHPTSII